MSNFFLSLKNKLFDSHAAEQSEPTEQAAAPAPAAAPLAAAPAPSAAIPPEIVAAIAAAVAALDENLTVCGIRRLQKRPGVSRRGVWGDAGVAQNTTPFI